MKDLYADNPTALSLSTGTPPWICPWQNGSAMPSNLATGKLYRGINVLMLSVEAMNHNYTDSRWLTFRQANELGTRIRKGEHGTSIVFYRLREVSEGRTKRCCCGWQAAFNAAVTRVRAAKLGHSNASR
jgi:antirestriction protein ArdC